MDNINIKGPTLPVNEPGSYKLFDIYYTTNSLTYHPINRETARIYNAPLVSYSPPLPERGAMRDVAVFPHAAAHRIPRTTIKKALKTTYKSEMSAKYQIQCQPTFETPIPRQKYLDEWNNKHVRCLTGMYLSEYSYNIANKISAARNLVRF